MKIRIGLIACLVFAHVPLVAALGQQEGDPASTAPSSPSVALDTAAALVHFYKGAGERVWPGYDLSQRPLLIYVPEQWVLLLNARGDVTGFEDYPDTWPDLGTRSLLHSGSYENLVGQLAFDLELGDLRTVAVPVVEDHLPTGHPDQRLYWFAFVVHEAFHQHQRETFASVEGEVEERYPILDAENTALIVLEMRLLMDALGSTASADRGEVEEQAAAFVAVREQRWRRADEFLERYEKAKELVEGTAKYVEAKSVGLLADSCASRGPQGPLAPVCEEAGTISVQDYLLQDFEKRFEQGTLPPEQVARNRIYAVGGTLGVLLDFLGVDWRTQAIEGGRDFSFVALLRRAIGSDDAAAAERLAWARQYYDYASILSASRDQIDRYVRSYEAALAEFEGQAGRRVSVRVPAVGLSRSRSSRTKRWVADAGARVFSSHFNVYSLKTVPGEDFLLQVKDAGLLDETDRSANAKTVTFFASDLTNVDLNGEPRDLVPGETYRFEALSMSGGRFHLRCTRPGVLVVGERKLTIDLIPERPR
jgi:hypothetical protein